MSQFNIVGGPRSASAIARSFKHRPPLQRFLRPLLMQPSLVNNFLRIGRIFHAGDFPSTVRFTGKIEGDGSKLVTTDDMQRYSTAGQQSDPLVELGRGKTPAVDRDDLIA